MMSKTGSVLIISLWTLSLLTALVVSAGRNQSVNLRRMRIRYEDFAAQNLANAAFNKTLFELTEFVNQNPQGPVSYKDEVFREAAIALETGTASYQIFDEASRIDLNQTNAAKKPSVFSNFPGSSPEIANSIIDWQDSDDSPLPGGAENNYYRYLDEPYDCKDGEVDRVEELLLIKGIDEEFYDQVKTMVTLFGQPQVNINTAGSGTLETLFKASGVDTDIAVGLAEEITSRRDESEDFVISGDDILGDLIDLVGDLYKDDLSKLTATALISANSSYFRIEISATAYGHNITKRITSIVKIEPASPPEILYYHQD